MSTIEQQTYNIEYIYGLVKSAQEKAIGVDLSVNYVKKGKSEEFKYKTKNFEDNLKKFASILKLDPKIKSFLLKYT